MGFFSRKGKEDERLKEEKKKELEKILRRYRGISIPAEKTKFTTTSREYRLFRETEKRRKGWFEILAGFAEKFIRVSPGKSTASDIEKAAAFTGLQVTPTSVMSLAAMSILLFVVLGAVFILAVPDMIIGGIGVMAIGAAVAYFILKYPANYVKTVRIRASSQVVLAILYMVVSMRISPNMERALRFSAANISGALAWDMRRMLWDIEMGKYYSANEALTDYIAKWKPENEEFAEALRLIRDSQMMVPARAERTLDEALTVILEGTKTRMKHYAQELKLPVMVIHMMGIVLPVLGTIMAPLAAIFLSNLVSPLHFIIVYDIALPLFILWFINNTLQKRPTTFSQIDMSRHPELPPEGSFLLKLGEARRMALPALPIALIIALVFITPAVYYFAQNPGFLVPPVDPGTGKYITVEDPSPILTLVMSSLFVLGAAFALATYFLLSNFQRVRIEDEIRKTEGEFELALFQLGNRIAAGTPTELALEKSLDDVRDLEIAGLFRLTLRNIRNLGMTFKEALFSRRYGSLRYYPSRLVYNIMYTVVDTAKKGISYAAEAMLTISKYLKNIRETQEYIRDTLSDTVSSMKFQAYMLTPIITGLIVAMAQVIIQVLVFLGNRLGGMGLGDAAGGDMGLGANLFFGEMGAASITPALFQLMIGVYLVEVMIILSIFLTKITQGEDKVAQWSLAGRILIVGIVMYFLVSIFASTVFGNLITSAVQSLA